MVLSVGFVRYRDVRPIWEVVLQMNFYASGIFIVIANPKSRSTTSSGCRSTSRTCSWRIPSPRSSSRPATCSSAPSYPTARERDRRRRADADPDRHRRRRARRSASSCSTARRRAWPSSCEWPGQRVARQLEPAAASRVRRSGRVLPPVRARAAGRRRRAGVPRLPRRRARASRCSRSSQELDPDVVLVFRPEIIPAGAVRNGLRALTIGYLTEPLPRDGRQRRTRTCRQRMWWLEQVDAGNFDRIVSFDPLIAETAEQRAARCGARCRSPSRTASSWTCAPRAQPPRLLFVGRSTEHREELLAPIKRVAPDRAHRPRPLR